MKDQDLLTDLLLTEKKMSGNYTTFASECVNMQLKDAFLQLLTTSHRSQSELYNVASQRGWYQTEQAQQQKIMQAQQKFSAQMPSLG